MVGRPAAAFVLSLIGGIAVLAAGLALVGQVITPVFVFVAGEVLWMFPIIGALIIVSSILMFIRPSSARTLGAVGLVLGAISLIELIAFGGIFSIVGGILAMRLTFLSQAGRTLKLATKPGRSELWLSIRISLLGIGLIGIIGFVIRLLASVLNPGTVASS